MNGERDSVIARAKRRSNLTRSNLSRWRRPRASVSAFYLTPVPLSLAGEGGRRPTVNLTRQSKATFRRSALSALSALSAPSARLPLFQHRSE